MDRGFVALEFELLVLTLIVSRLFFSGGCSSWGGPSYAVLYEASWEVLTGEHSSSSAIKRLASLWSKSRFSKMSSSFMACSDYAWSDRLSGLVFPYGDFKVLSGWSPKYNNISLRPCELINRCPDFLEPDRLGGERVSELIFVGE